MPLLVFFLLWLLLFYTFGFALLLETDFAKGPLVRNSFNLLALPYHCLTSPPAAPTKGLLLYKMI